MNTASEYLAYQARREARLRWLDEELRKRLDPDKPVVLEAGCGHGHFLTAYAAEHPDHFCLGVDLMTRRVSRSDRKRKRSQLSNLAFLKADINEVLSVWPENSPILRLFMLFPDPWPKKRHFKHRMVQDDFLLTLARCMHPEGLFYFRTDHGGYFTWTEEHLRQHQAWMLAPGEVWPFEQPTLFQERMVHYRSLIAKISSADFISIQSG